MYRFMRILSLLSIIGSLCTPSRPVGARSIDDNPISTSTTPSLVSPDSLERPSIIYHNQRQGNDYTHADMSISDGMRLSAMVYSRQEGDRYKVYYQQRPTLNTTVIYSPMVG